MKVQVSHRLDECLLTWATQYAQTRGSSRAVIIEEALRHFRDLSAGGVPDLPVVDSPEVRQQRAVTVDPEATPMARQRRLAREMGWSS